MTVLILSNFSRHYLCTRATIFDYIDGNSPKHCSPEVRMIRPENILCNHGTHVEGENCKENLSRST